MPEISRFLGIVIKMYYKDQQPPHFHAEYGEHAAEIEIATLSMMDGELPRRARNLVLEWAFEHREELQANWTRARAQESLLPIAPLE